MFRFIITILILKISLSYVIYRFKMAYRDPDLRSRYYSHTVTDTSIDRSIRKRINASITSYLFITLTTVSIALCTSSTS